ncbi:MAG: lipopolysaccharide biosynthesis protein [Cyanobacteria bacterium P01_G01_bin.4]
MVNRAQISTAVRWSGLEAVAHQLTQFFVTVVLARLLTPADFGLIALVAIVIATTTAISTAGLIGSLIQKEEVSDTEVSTVFYIVLIFAVVAFAAVFASADWLAAFFGQEALNEIVPLLASTILINAIGAPHYAMLARDLRFKRIASADLVALTVASATAIFLALKDLGYWVLVAQQVCFAATRTLSLWTIGTWKPTLAFDLVVVKPHLAYGSRTLIGGLLGQVSSHLYSTAIGKLFGATEAGLYSRALQLQRGPSRTIGRGISRVNLSVFARLQGDKVSIRRSMLDTINLLVFLTLPLMALLALLAEPIIVLLFTEKWIACVPYVQLLAVVGMLYPLHLVNVNALLGTGQAKLFQLVEAAKLLLAILNIAVLWQHGVYAILYGQIVVSFVALYLNCRATQEIVELGVMRQLFECRKYVLAAITAVVFILLFKSAEISWFVLIGQLILGGLVYVAVCLFLKAEALSLALQAGGFRKAKWFK